MITIDYSDWRNLIIPTPRIEDHMLLGRDGGDSLVLIHGHLFVTGGEWKHCLDRNDVETVLYPSQYFPDRYLLYKAGSASAEAEPATASEMALFYRRHSPWEVDADYLSRLLADGERPACRRLGGRIASLAYTTKGRRQVNCLFTRAEARRQGLAGQVLSQLGPVYAFVDDPQLIPFYNDNGFEVVQGYRLLDRRKRNENSRLCAE